MGKSKKRNERTRQRWGNKERDNNNKPKIPPLVAVALALVTVVVEYGEDGDSGVQREKGAGDAGGAGDEDSDCGAVDADIGRNADGSGRAVLAGGAGRIAANADSVDGCYGVAMARGVVFRGRLRGGRGRGGWRRVETLVVPTAERGGASRRS